MPDISTIDIKEYERIISNFNKLEPIDRARVIGYIEGQLGSRNNEEKSYKTA